MKRKKERGGPVMELASKLWGCDK
jgi:hypothetical protein